MELRVFFLAVDSTGQHAAGEPVEWRNRIEVRHRFFATGKELRCELEASPTVPIRYTCDGSDPKNGGGLYGGAFAVPAGSVCVLAVADKDGVSSGVQKFEVPELGREEEVRLDPLKPARWRRPAKTDTTKDSYELIERLRKHGATAPGVRVTIHGTRWVELTTDDRLDIAPDKLAEALKPLRELLGNGEVRLEAPSVHFSSGQHLLDWVAEAKTTIQPGEVQQ